MGRVGKCCCNTTVPCCTVCNGTSTPAVWSFTFDGNLYTLNVRSSEAGCEWFSSISERTVAGCTVNAVLLQVINRTDGTAWRLAFYHTDAPNDILVSWQEIAGPPNGGEAFGAPVPCWDNVELTETASDCGAAPASVTITPSGFFDRPANCGGSVSCQHCCADGTRPTQMLVEIPPGAFSNWGASPYCQACSSINGSFVLDIDPESPCTWVRAIGPYCGYDRMELSFTNYAFDVNGDGECALILRLYDSTDPVGSTRTISAGIASYDNYERVLDCSAFADFEIPPDIYGGIGECNPTGSVYVSAL